MRNKTPSARIMSNTKSRSQTAEHHLNPNSNILTKNRLHTTETCDCNSPAACCNQAAAAAAALLHVFVSDLVELQLLFTL